MVERALGNDPNEGDHVTKAFSRILVNIRDVHDDSEDYAEALEETERPDMFVTNAAAVPCTLFTSVAGIDTVQRKFAMTSNFAKTWTFTVQRARLPVTM
jgi:hypothetical protein